MMTTTAPTTITIVCLLVLTTITSVSSSSASYPRIKYQTITNPLFDNGTSAAFGANVRVSGDGECVVVGAQYEDTTSGGEDTGAVFIYKRTSTANQHFYYVEQTIVPSGVTKFSFVGQSVDIDATCSRVVFGAQDAAYVYVRNTTSGTWSEEVKLAETPTGRVYGEAIAISGDGATVVVGASGDDELGEDAGAAYIYTRDTGTNVWSTPGVKILPADCNCTNGRFGHRLAVTHDGARVFVGAPYDSTGGLNYAGAAYVFRLDTDGNWTTGLRLVAPAGSQTYSRAANDQFGSSLSVRDDVVLIGAYRKTLPGKTAAGAVYIYERNVNNNVDWDYFYMMVDNQGGANDQFGVDVSLKANISIIGANKRDGCGKALVFRRILTNFPFWQQTVDPLPTNCAAGTTGYYATSVTIQDDGVAAVVGSPQYFHTPQQAGYMVVWAGSSPPTTVTPTPAPTQTPTSAPTPSPTPPTLAPSMAPTLAPTSAPTPAPTTTPAPSPPSNSSGGGGDGLSGGGIAGIVIATLVVVGVAGFFYWRHHRRQQMASRMQRMHSEQELEWQQHQGERI